MSGHSKWANIKHKKAAQDKKRGKIWTKLIREITVAARIGPDLDSNPRLRLAMDKAVAGNMPKDTIERAIKRGSGDQDGESYEELRYEGYGPGGTAVIVDCMTDNRNRTASEVRHAFSKCGGNLGTDGSVAYLFNRLGVLTYAPGVDEDTVMEAAIEAGADDVVASDDGSVEVLTSPEAFEAVKKAMEAAGLAPEDAELTLRSDTIAELDAESAGKVLRLIDMLEDLDDVQEVFTNAEIADDILEALEG